MNPAAAAVDRKSRERRGEEAERGWKTGADVLRSIIGRAIVMGLWKCPRRVGRSAAMVGASGGDELGSVGIWAQLANSEGGDFLREVE